MAGTHHANAAVRELTIVTELRLFVTANTAATQGRWKKSP